MNKTALITGAARGIGLATAKLFLEEGWNVALLDKDEAGLQAAWKELDNTRVIELLPTDVADEAAIDTAFEMLIASCTSLDALVNNAGEAVFKPLRETSAEEWQRVIDVNLSGPFYCAKKALPLMEPDGGAIVNVASISGLRASTLRVAYGTSKAALMHLTKQMAVEFASLGVRVNCVAPGPVDTEMAKAVHSPEIRADYHDAIPLGRYGLEQEIAEAIWFLCSDASKYITGQTLAVDGGFDATGIGLKTLRDGQGC